MDPKLSLAIFGNSYMARVVSWLALEPSPVVTVREAAAALGVADSLVRPVYLRLVAAKLLRPLPKTGGLRGKQFFERADPELWKPLCALMHHAEHRAGVGL